MSKSIYELKLHEAISIRSTSATRSATSYYQVMRVAGGWLYQVWDTEKQDYTREIFVPFNNEFMEKGGEDEA